MSAIGRSVALDSGYLKGKSSRFLGPPIIDLSIILRALNRFAGSVYKPELESYLHREMQYSFGHCHQDAPMQNDSVKILFTWRGLHNLIYAEHAQVKK